MSLEFKDEMLIPSINGTVYFQIYEVENWLRRICLTAYMKEFGCEWMSHIPTQILNGLKNRSARSEELFYLDLDKSENVIWAATHGELAKLILNDSVSEQIKLLTGFNNTSLSQKLEELKDIRNLLAHNRPLTSAATTIVAGVITSLSQGIKIFKTQILYSGFNANSYSRDEVCLYFDEKMSDNDWNKFQAFIYLDSGIYSLSCLPMGNRENGFGKFLSASRLLGFYSSVLEHILAFSCCKNGGEYSVLFTDKITNAAKKEIVEVFVETRNAGIRDFWTTTPFEKQNPRYICNPKIWFYQDPYPIDE